MEKFRKYNIEATEENIKEAIKNDNYGRSKDIQKFIEALDMIDTNAFISLDAKWGEGKTFFIRQIEMTLKYLLMESMGEDTEDYTEDYTEIFSTSCLKSLSLENTYLPIYYNSWYYDCHKDPLMSLLFVLVKECGKYVSTKMNSKSIGDKIISILSSLSLTLPGIQISGDTKKITENLTGRDILEEIKTAEEIRDIVKQILDEIIKERAQKLVIFIDELDRCKPSYAIEILERIKHYFEDGRIIFIFSVNKEQLVHTISKYYGNEFDSTGYLNKFFDLNIHLPEIPQINRENGILKTKDEQYYLKHIVNDLGEYFNLSLRDTIIFHQKIEATSKQFYNDYTAQGCMISIFVPIMQILDIVNQEQKRKFMQGDGDILKELFDNVSSLHKMATKFGKDRQDTIENYEIGYEAIKKVYDYTFGNCEECDYAMNIPADLKNICIRVCNGF